MATFEWDESKSRRNRSVHGVRFEEAVSAFADPLGRIVDDPRHSREEPRYALIAQSERGRILVVMFTERGERIRVISARRATPTERRQYEEASR
jgi:uncharacterized protein